MRNERVAQAVARADDAMIAAMRVLRDEHLAFTSVLYALRRSVSRVAAGAPPDIALLEALVDYVVAFPERLHHPKESRYLFAALVARAPDTAPLVDELEREHARGATMIDALIASLRRFGGGDTAEAPRLARAVDDYARFHADHTSKEEDRLLPLAERFLTAADWATIADAFCAGERRRAGIAAKDELDILYRRVLALWTSSRGRANLA